jgi:secretion/DNA translocation related CpaE-like protein
MSSRHALVVAADPDLRSVLVRLATAASLVAEPVEPSVVASRWRPGAALLLDPQCADVVLAAGWTFRPDVCVVAAGRPGPLAYRAAAEVGASGVFGIPGDEAALLQRLAPTSGGSQSHGRVLAVIGSSGGVGTSTLAAALALTPTAGATGLVDLDPGSGGLDVVLGMEGAPGVRWPDLVTDESIDPRWLVSAAPRHQPRGTQATVSLVSWDRRPAPPASTRLTGSVLTGLQDCCELVVADLGRNGLDVVGDVMRRADGVVLVVPASVAGVAAATRLTATLADVGPAWRVVVREVAPRELTAARVAAVLGLPVAATLATDAAIRIAAAHGEPPPTGGRSALAPVCRAVLDDVALARAA